MSLAKLGHELASARISKHLSVDAAATRAGLTPARLQAMEAGRTHLQAWELTDLVKVIEMDRAAIDRIGDPLEVLPFLWCPAVGQVLRQARAKRDINEVAVAAGVSAASIQRWEKAMARPRAAKLSALLSTLGVTAYELVTAAIWPPQHPPLARRGLAEVLYETRMRLGLSQYQMAARLGVSQGTYLPWELGRNRPGARNMKRIAEYLEVSVDELYAARQPIPVDTYELSGVPKLLVEARLDAGLTRAAAARRLGITSTTITSWESGTRLPRVHLVPKVAEAYALDPVEFAAALLQETCDGSTFGAWLRVRLTAGGERYHDFADRLGVHRNQVMHWCTNRSRPSAANCARIDRCLRLARGATAIRVAQAPAVDPGPFARALRARRAALGLTRVAMAKRLGVEPGNMQGWEEGKHRPAAHLHASIASGMGCKTAEVAALVAA